MKRLFSILLINAWNGLRYKASLPTLGMVVVGLMALFVTSTVAAGASPKPSTPGVRAVATIIHHDLLKSLPLHIFVSSKPASPSTRQPRTAPSTTQQPAGSGTGIVSPLVAANSTGTTSPAGSQGPSQVSTPSLSFTPVEPESCSQGQTTYTISSAQLTLPTPTASGATVSGYWEIRYDSGSNAGQPPTSTASFTQSVPAGETSITISNTTDSTQPLYSASSDSSYAYSFRLHVTSPVDIASSPWISVAETASSCPMSN